MINDVIVKPVIPPPAPATGIAVLRASFRFGRVRNARMSFRMVKEPRNFVIISTGVRVFEHNENRGREISDWGLKGY